MEDIELLRDFRGHVARNHAVARLSARARLRHQMTARPRSRLPLLSHRGVLPLALLAAVLALALVLNPWLGGRDGGLSAAASQLNAAAERAASLNPPPALAAGQFSYTRSDTAWTVSASATTGGSAVAIAIMPRMREIWIGADGSGRIAQTMSGELIWLSDPDPGLEAILARSAGMDETFGPGGLATADEISGLSLARMAELEADAGALRAWVTARVEDSDSPSDYQSFVVVGDLLRESTLLPEFRAAVYRFAATIPGVQLLGEVTDSAGRSGIAVAKVHEGVRHELIFDPTSAQLLEERRVVVSADSHYPAEPGTIVGRATYLVTTVVSSIDERP